MARLGDKIGLLCSTVVREAEAAIQGILAPGPHAGRSGSTSLPVGRLARETEGVCQKLLALRHPASDLRFLTTALKIIVDLQRIGEVSGRIRKMVAFLPGSRLSQATSLLQLAGLCLAQVRAAIAAFVDLDPVQAGNVMADRELLTSAHQRAVTDLLSLMIEDESHRPFAEGMLGVARQLDALGDQAANAGHLVVSMLCGDGLSDADQPSGSADLVEETRFLAPQSAP